MKQVIVVNDALQLPAGKMAAQVAHASLAAFLRASSDTQQAWLEQGMPKIVLICSSEEALTELLSQAEAAHIAAWLVRDAGKTVVPSGTRTCLGIGPAPADDIDRLTGDLRLM